MVTAVTGAAFNGTTSQIKISATAHAGVAAFATGTFLVLSTRSVSTLNNAWLSGETNGNSELVEHVAHGTSFGGGVPGIFNPSSGTSNGSVQITSAHGWTLYGHDKLTGSTVPRHHTVRAAIGTWTHEAGSASVGDTGDFDSGSEWYIGSEVGAGEFFEGEISLVAWWSGTRINDAIFESWLSGGAISLASILLRNPTRIWYDLTATQTSEVSRTAITTGTASPLNDDISGVARCVGVGAPVNVDSATTAIPFPSGYTAVAGDYCVIEYVARAGHPTTPGSHTIIVQSAGSVYTGAFLRTKFTGGETAASVTVGSPGAVLWTKIYRGVDGTTPLDVAGTTNAANATCPSITTASNNSLICNVHGTFSVGTIHNFSSANGYFMLTNESIATGFNANNGGQQISSGSSFKSAGAAGTYTGPTITLSTGDDAQAITYALRSDAGTPVAPATPAAPVAEPRGNKVYAYLAAAPADNGFAISDYQWEYRVNGGSWTSFSDGTSTALTVTVTGLTAYTSVEIRVAATNAGGNSSFSSASNAVVPYRNDEAMKFTDNTLVKFSDGTQVKMT